MKIMKKQHYVSPRSELLVVERSALVMQSPKEITDEDNNADAKENGYWGIEENDDNKGYSRFDLWK